MTSTSCPGKAGEREVSAGVTRIAATAGGDVLHVVQSQGGDPEVAPGRPWCVCADGPSPGMRSGREWRRTLAAFLAAGSCSNSPNVHPRIQNAGRATAPESKWFGLLGPSPHAGRVRGPPGGFSFGRPAFCTHLGLIRAPAHAEAGRGGLLTDNRPGSSKWARGAAPKLVDRCRHLS